MRTSHLRWLYAAVIMAGLLSVAMLRMHSQHPARLIEGEWKELQWEYEQVNRADTENAHFKRIGEEVKALIGEKLVIHKSEVWRFLPGGQLQLEGQQGHKTINWKLSGRGHILELKHRGAKESYNVVTLNDSLLVIHFDTDLEVRGIAKLTFIKTLKNDAL